MTDTATPKPEPLEGIIVGSQDGTQLVTIQTRPVVDIFTAPGLVPALLAAVRTEAARDFTPDVTTAKGREAIKAQAFKVTKTKTYLEDLGKKEAARLKALVKPLDDGRKALWDGLERIQAETRKPLTEWEMIRETWKQTLGRIQNLPTMMFRATAAQLEEKIAELRPLAVDSERWEEMASEASGIKTATLATLEGMLEKAKQAEEDARELQRLKDAEVKRKQEENDERLRKEGEQRALLAQQQAQAPQVVVPIPQTLQPAEQASASSGEPAKGPWFPAAMLPPGPIQVIEATPLTFPQADSLRRGEPVSYSQEASAVEHRRGFNREALADLQAAIIAPASGVQNSEDAAKAILTAIVTGKVRHIAITY